MKHPPRSAWVEAAEETPIGWEGSWFHLIGLLLIMLVWMIGFGRLFEWLVDRRKKR